MKKILVALSVLLLSAVVIIKAVNAQNTPQDNKKAATENKMSGKCADTKTCCMKAEKKTCDMAKCKEMMSSDTAKCKANSSKCKGMTAEAKSTTKKCCEGMTKN